MSIDQLEASIHIHLVNTELLDCRVLRVTVAPKGDIWGDDETVLSVSPEPEDT